MQILQNRWENSYMNILYVAVSCDPYNGSEDKIGWNVPWEMSKTENVWIVTRRDLKKSIDKFLGDNEKRKLKMVYVEMPEICNKVFKGKKGISDC